MEPQPRFSRSAVDDGSDDEFAADCVVYDTPLSHVE